MRWIGKENEDWENKEEERGDMNMRNIDGKDVKLQQECRALLHSKLHLQK